MESFRQYAHKLIVSLQQQFGIKDSMLPLEEQLFDNLIHTAFEEFQETIKPLPKLIEIEGCSLNIDHITAIQFDNKEYLKAPDNRSGLRCRIIMNGDTSQVFTFYGKSAVRIRSFCEQYQLT